MYICQWKENGLVAKFVGETGDSAYHRQKEHAMDIKRKQNFFFLSESLGHVSFTINHLLLFNSLESSVYVLHHPEDKH